MTKESDQLQPEPKTEGLQDQPGQQQPDTDPNKLNFTAAAEEVVDLDDAEVTAAKEAAKAEGAADTGDGEQGADKPGAQGVTAADKSQQSDQGQGKKPEAIMVPKERLDDVLNKQREAETSAAYWRGVAEARGQIAKPGDTGGPQQQQQPQFTPAQRLDAIHAAKDALATKFDDGEITMADMTKQQRELDNQEQSIREDAMLAKVQPKAAASNDELYLNTLTADLETQHPWVGVADQVASQADWDWMKAKAIDNLVAKGIDPRAGSNGRYELRREIAEIADQVGPSLFADLAKAKGIALPGQQQQQQQHQQGQQLSPEAQRRKAALDKAAGAPPNLHNMQGTADDGQGMPTDARLETMSDEAIAALPDSTRRKLMGIVA